MDNAVSEEARRLIATGISSMDHVDLLYHLTRGEATGAELAAATRFSGPLVDRLVDQLVAVGLVHRRDDRVSITDQDRDRRAIDELLEIYHARPVTLVRAIYARESLGLVATDALNPRRDR